jgi:hypothetical protein
MKIRKNFDPHNPIHILILGKLSDYAMKVSLWFARRWWKGADEWTRWITRVILAKTFIALPALGIGVGGAILLFRYNVPLMDRFGVASGESILLYLGTGFLFIFLVTNRSLSRWLGQHVDLEVPVYICIRKHCCGNLLYHPVEKAGRLCPYCKGEVRLLSADEKRRPY